MAEMSLFVHYATGVNQQWLEPIGFDLEGWGWPDQAEQAWNDKYPRKFRIVGPQDTCNNVITKFCNFFDDMIKKGAIIRYGFTLDGNPWEILEE